MKKAGFSFEFSIPDGWKESEGTTSARIFHGPASQELIVSGAIIAGDGSPQDAAKAQARLRENAIASLTEAVSHPELTTTTPLHREEDIDQFECWTVRSESTDEEVFFGGVLAVSDIGVLIATLECPAKEDSSGLLEEFFYSLRLTKPC
jgi:hypothetical protein